MAITTTPESVAFTYVEKNIGSNYKVSHISTEDGKVRVTFDGYFRGKCPTCGRQIEQKVESVFSMVIRKKDFKIIEKPNLKELKDNVIKAGLGFLLGESK